MSAGDDTVTMPEHPRAVALLDLDYVFTQRRLLTPKKFIDEAAARGLNLQIGHLEAAHKVGLLTPLFRIDFSKRLVRRIASQTGYFTHPDFTVQNLRELRDSGQLVDVDTEGYRSWSGDLVTAENRSFAASRYLYSPWQLLKLVELRLELPGFRHAGRSRLGPRYLAPRPTAFSVLRLPQWIFVILCALEPIYFPDVILRTSGGLTPSPDEWFREFQTWVLSQHADDLARWMGLDAEQITELADALTIRTRFFDPLREWTDLIRLMSPDKWEQLTGEAKLAIDHRIASELLYRLREDMTRAGFAAPLPLVAPRAWTPRLERWNRPAETLDRVLNDFGLSPEPSLVWAVEGQVEVALAGRLMDYLDVPRYRSFIHIHDVGGNDKDYGLLAQYVAVPTTGEMLGEDFVLLDRPVTRFLVSTDPENKLLTAEGRANLRKAIVTSIFNKLVARFQTEAVYSQIDQMVSIETWRENESFEFAHFTDLEICSAIRAAYSARNQTSVEVDEAQVATSRSRRGNLKSLLNRLPPPELKKDELAEFLWPYLKEKVDAAAANKALETIPLVRHLQLAIELATTSFRRHVGMKL